MDACFVPSERLAILAHKCGLAPDKVRLHGLPIRAGFWREQSAKTELQAKLGLKPEVKTCLVVGGGDGVGRLEAIARSVGRRLGQDEEESQVGGRAGARSGEAGDGGGWVWLAAYIEKMQVLTATRVLIVVYMGDDSSRRIVSMFSTIAPSTPDRILQPQSTMRSPTSFFCSSYWIFRAVLFSSSP